jgi:hypothetical protein
MMRSCMSCIWHCIYNISGQLYWDRSQSRIWCSRLSSCIQCTLKLSCSFDSLIYSKQESGHIRTRRIWWQLMECSNRPSNKLHSSVWNSSSRCIYWLWLFCSFQSLCCIKGKLFMCMFYNVCGMKHKADIWKLLNSDSILKYSWNRQSLMCIIGMKMNIIYTRNWQLTCLKSILINMSNSYLGHSSYSDWCIICIS